jgi:hypothetical protein
MKTLWKVFTIVIREIWLRWIQEPLFSDIPERPPQKPADRENSATHSRRAL